MAKTIADLEAAEHSDRIERIRELVAESLDGSRQSWPNRTDGERIHDLIHELERIGEAAAEIVYMPADEVFTDAAWTFDGVVFLGEDGDAGVIRGHLAAADAIAQVDRAYGSYTGKTLRQAYGADAFDGVQVKHLHAVFMQALPEEEFDWWCRTVDDPDEGRTEPVTWVDFW